MASDTNSYTIDIWLPDDSAYPALKWTSAKIKKALDDELDDVQKGNAKIKFKPQCYNASNEGYDVDSDSVAAISFSEDFAQKCNSKNVAVLAMMGGVLPAGKNFFRMGFSVETIAAIIGDQIINDNDGRVSHVFLIRVDNDLGNEFERAFSRAVNAPNLGRSLDILKIDENGTPIIKKIQITQTDEQVARNTSTNEGVISKWLTSCINNPKRPRNQGLRSVVIYGYWEQYWNFVIEVLRCKAFCNDEDWLYVESNYPLHYPFILYEARHVDDLDQDDLQNFTKERTDDIIPRSVEITSSGKNNKRIMGDKKQEKTGGESPEKPTESVFHPQKGNLRNNNEDERDFNIFNEKKMAHASTIAHAITNRDEPEEEHQKESKELGQEKLMPRELKRIRCITGRLVNDGESSFITFAKETVRLLCAAIRDANDKLTKKEDPQTPPSDDIPFIRKRIREFLRKSKFYASEHLGSFFFRKDGELFFPLYRYNGKLDRQRNARESCCKDEEFTKEAIADQLLQLSNSLNKITQAEIPRNLEVGNSDGAKNVFEEFSKMIAEISGGIEIDFISYFPNTERQFYTWADKQEGNVNKTEQFINVCIFDDVCKKIQGVIQINLKDFDLEDNDAYRVYLVYERTGNVFDALTLAEWWNRQNDVLQSKIVDGNEGWESDLLPVKAVVFTRSRIRKQDGHTGEGLSKDEYKSIIDNAKYVHYYRDDHESKFKFDEILRGLCQLLECRQNTRNSKLDSKSNASFLYYIPEYVPEDDNSECDNSSKTKDAGDGQGGIVITTRYKLPLFDLQIIENMVSRIFSKLKTCLAGHDVLLSNIKSAIGSIMSRNGSHNIGSHVLAALSHNVGTMPEDRKLYQYIQHRMDYIATATTDFPVWRQPTLLVSDMMRTFLSQTHLLNYISGSEGLHAYQFQNPTVDPSAQHETIKLHVRRVREWEYEPAASDCDYGEGPHDEIDSRAIVYKGKTTGISYFIVYPDQEEPLASFDQDLSVAIPGGVVGQHAFFTILENLIRNAAKHEWSKAEWSKPEDKDKPAVYKDQSDLEVYVDFRDNPQEGVVEMLVWNDRVGKASSGMGKTVKSLTDKIKSSFISPETGELVRENWGLAEMRISAGFLKHAEIDTIGGIGEKEGAAIDLVRPVVVRHGDKECLGFRFDFLKPKELLVVVSDDVEEASIQSANEVLSRFGIEMMRMEDALKSKGLAYSYVLIDGFDFKRSENEWPKLPFRVLSPTDYSTETDSVAARRVAFYDGDLYHSQNGEEFPAKIKSLVDEWKDGDKAKKFAHRLLEDIYACWVNHVRKARGVSREAPLIVDVAGGEGGSAKSLVTDSDLIHYVFEHSFNSAVRSYLKMIDDDSINDDDGVAQGASKETRPRTRLSPQLAGALYSLVMLKVKPVMSVNDFANCNDNATGAAKQLLRFVNAATELPQGTIKADATDSDGSYTAKHWKTKIERLTTQDCLNYLYHGCKSITENEGGDKFPDVRSFVDYLCNVTLEQARSFLSKYEERVVTLPPSFGHIHNATSSEESEIDKQTGEESEKDKPKSWIRENGECVLTMFFSDDRSEAKKLLQSAKGMCYLRHGDSTSVAKTPSLTDDSFYVEPLSGSQSYLSSLIALQRNIQSISQEISSDKRLYSVRDMAGLVENASMRVLLIDERATKFAQEHSEVAQVFNDIGIYVCDDNNPTVVGLFDSKFDGFVDSTKRVLAKDCEIAVIHQGIIDKILKDHSEKTVEGFLDDMTNSFRYVVVTTGRGSPANIPATARVLPFSAVESTLFKRYPEKMLLVDTIMNILPGKETKR